METKDILHKNLMFIIRPGAENPPLHLQFKEILMLYFLTN